MMKVANWRVRMSAGGGLLAALLLASQAAASLAHGSTLPAAGAPVPLRTVGSAASSSAVATRPASVRQGNSYLLCTSPNATLCIDRDGDGYADGTHIIGWDYDSQDPAELFGIVVLTDWCNDGYVTETCPFTVGSGLNARYASACNGAPCEITGFNVTTDTTSCIGANPSWSAAILNECLPNGGAFVNSDTNGDFLIDVGASNYWFSRNHTNNQPYWLVTNGRGNQLIFSKQASNSWLYLLPG